MVAAYAGSDAYAEMAMGMAGAGRGAAIGDDIGHRGLPP